MPQQKRSLLTLETHKCNSCHDRHSLINRVCTYIIMILLYIYISIEYYISVSLESNINACSCSISFEFEFVKTSKK